jgi:AcrR family transcriptional regulator
MPKEVMKHVASGVFFTTPQALPRGRHQLSREDVLATHRERLMIAATELLAEKGAAGVGVREICTRAACSRAAFYDCFSDKYECIFAAYDRFITVIEQRISRARPTSADWQESITELIADYLSILQQDLVTARAFQVEMDSFGKEARRRRRESLKRLALLIHQRRDPGAEPQPSSLRPYLGAIYAVRQTASDFLDDDSTGNNLLDLADELGPWVSRTLTGPDAAHTQ